MEHYPSERLPETSPAAGPIEAEQPATVSTAALNSSPTRVSPDGWWAVGMGMIYLLFYQVTLRIPSEHIGVIWTTTLLSLLILLLFTVRVARALRSQDALAVNLLLAFLFACPFILAPILFARFPGWYGWTQLGPPLVSYIKLIGRVAGLNGLLLVWLAASLGVLISRIVREIKMLLPVAVALACMDLYVVFGGGAVKQAMSGHSYVAQAAMKSLTVNLATPHPTPHAAAPMQLAVGFADFMFIALFFACLVRFRIPARWTFIVLFAFLAAYMVLTSYVETLPALVPIAIVMIGMNLRRFRYSRSEVFALLYAGLIVIAVIGGLFFLSRR